MRRPIFIVGCPRSGTQLTARIIGQVSGTYLITEHKNKASIPEDRSGINEAALWWDVFDYVSWNEQGIPITEKPIYASKHIAEMRRIYTSLARERQLIVKNPNHIIRLEFIYEIFPDALFVFCARAPWPTIQSMTESYFSYNGSLDSFILRVNEVMQLPADPLLRAACSWGLAVQNFIEHQNENWFLLRYEALVNQPQKTIRDLFSFLQMNDIAAFNRSVCLPRRREKNYWLLKKYYQNSLYREEIRKFLQAGCNFLQYPDIPLTLPGTAKDYYLNRARIIELAKRLKRNIIHKIL